MSTAAPYDFQKSLLFFRGFTPIVGEQVTDDSSILKAVSIGGNSIAFKIRDTGGIENPRVSYEAYSEKKIPDGALSDRLSFFLSLDDDLRSFYEMAEKDPAFLPVLKRYYGHKQVKFLTPFENACWAILTQRLPMTVAHRAKLAIVEKFGGKITINDVTLKSFPEAQTLTSVDRSELVRLIKNERKCDYLVSASTAFSKVDEKWLRTGPYNEVYSWLREIKGFGEWSAHFVLIRGLGRMEQLSNVENNLAFAVSRVYGNGRKPTEKRKVMQLADRYGINQGYWAYYLRIYTEFSDLGTEKQAENRMNME